MFVKKHMIFLYFCFFVFQNCAPFEALNDNTIYPYSVAPVFFSDIKLVETSVDETGREQFIFDFVVSYATDPRQNVGYRLDYSTLSQSGVCRHNEGTVNNQTAHIRTQCTIPITDDIYVQVFLRGINNEEEIRQYRF